jgi:hypothetical protein
MSCDVIVRILRDSQDTFGEACLDFVKLVNVHSVTFTASSSIHNSGTYCIRPDHLLSLYKRLGTVI